MARRRVILVFFVGIGIFVPFKSEENPPLGKAKGRRLEYGALWPTGALGYLTT